MGYMIVWWMLRELYRDRQQMQRKHREYENWLMKSTEYKERAIFESMKMPFRKHPLGPTGPSGPIR